MNHPLIAGVLPASAERRQQLVAVVFLALFLCAYINTAWVSEDAFITFRTVDNALHGLGLTWNPDERVQTYTHPLWLGLLLPLTALFRDPYYVSIGLCFVLTLFVLLTLLRLARPLGLASGIAFASLLWSRAFVDFSSSGLENSLTHAALVAYAWCWLEMRDGRRKTLVLTLLFSALFLSRPDNVVIAGPSFAMYLWTRRDEWRAAFRPLIVGAIPAVAWVVFSIFYYGSPVPNTALAKVQTGVTWAQNFTQAVRYFAWTVENDPLSLLIMALGVAYGVFGAQRRLTSPLAANIVAWAIYLFYVGADYMGGRFFSAPCVLAVALLVVAFRQCRSGKGAFILLTVMVIKVSILQVTLLSPSDFSHRDIAPSGIADERGFYYQELGFKPVQERGIWVYHRWLLQGRSIGKVPGIYTRGTIGMTGYTAGPKIHWIDPLALAEPFLARLPARTNTRVGHYERAFPPGFLDSETTGENRLNDPGLAELYNDVRLATRAPLLADGRAAAIWRLNSGYYAGRLGGFNREAVGLPGFAHDTTSPLSYFGISYDGATSWRIIGDPARAEQVAPR